MVVGLGEDPEKAALRLAARTGAPLLVDLCVEGSALVEHAPSRLPDLFGKAPALLSLALRPEGGELLLRGRTPEGGWEQRIQIDEVAEGTGNEAIAALFGREKVEDLEMRLAAGGGASEIDREIERVGIEHRVSTRLTSWVAVSEERTVDPEDPRRRVRQPHELPHGMSAEGLGLRPAYDARTMQTRAGMVMPGAFAEMTRMAAGALAKSKIDLKARLGKRDAEDEEDARTVMPAPVAPPSYAPQPYLAPTASRPSAAQQTIRVEGVSGPPAHRLRRSRLGLLLVALLLVVLPIVLWLLLRR